MFSMEGRLQCYEAKRSMLWKEAWAYHLACSRLLVSRASSIHTHNSTVCLPTLLLVHMAPSPKIGRLEIRGLNGGCTIPCGRLQCEHA